MQLEASWKLAELLVLHWANLTSAQRESLRPVFVKSFDRFRNWMGALLVADILSEHYADDEAFKNLDELSERARMPHRALAAYGIGKLARTVNSEALRLRAVERLKALRKDEAEQVRSESTAALGKLGEA
jgi:hypothetical protein